MGIGLGESLGGWPERVFVGGCTKAGRVGSESDMSGCGLSLVRLQVGGGFEYITQEINILKIRLRCGPVHDTTAYPLLGTRHSSLIPCLVFPFATSATLSDNPEIVYTVK